MCRLPLNEEGIGLLQYKINAIDYWKVNGKHKLVCSCGMHIDWGTGFKIEDDMICDLCGSKVRLK